MSKKLQNVFVVCAMILVFAAWVLVVIFRIAPCANQIKEAGYEDAGYMIWALAQIISLVGGWATGKVGGKLLSKINGWNSED